MHRRRVSSAKVPWGAVRCKQPTFKKLFAGTGLLGPQTQPGYTAKARSDTVIESAPRLCFFGGGCSCRPEKAFISQGLACSAALAGLTQILARLSFHTSPWAGVQARHEEVFRSVGLLCRWGHEHEKPSRKSFRSHMLLYSDKDASPRPPWVSELRAATKGVGSMEQKKSATSKEESCTGRGTSSTQRNPRAGPEKTNQPSDRKEARC